MRMGMILAMPLPNTFTTITIPKAISASHQLFLQLEIAVGARPKPIATMMGPVTTGGKKRITLLMPIILMMVANTKYSKPAQATPTQA